MTVNHTRRFKTAAATIALATATSMAAAPAQAAPSDTGAVQYVAQASGSADGGSLENPVVGAGLVLLAGVGVSIALAIGAGVAGGAFELPQIPGF